MNKDFLKEKIAYYKLWITILTTLDAGLIAWTYNHFKNISGLSYMLIGFVILFFTLALLIINQKARIFLRKLED